MILISPRNLNPLDYVDPLADVDIFRCFNFERLYCFLFASCKSFLFRSLLYSIAKSWICWKKYVKFLVGLKVTVKEKLDCGFKLAVLGVTVKIERGWIPSGE